VHIAIVSKHYKASHMFLKTSTTSSMIQSSKLLIARKSEQRFVGLQANENMYSAFQKPQTEDAKCT